LSRGSGKGRLGWGNVGGERKYEARERKASVNEVWCVLRKVGDGRGLRCGKAGFILSERAARSWRHGRAQRTESRVLGCSAGRPERPGRRTALDRRRGPPRLAAQPAPTRREVHWTARVVQYRTVLHSTVLYAGVARPRRCLPCLFDWLFWRAGSYRGARQIAPRTGLLCDESTDLNVWYTAVVYSGVYPVITAQDGTSAP
jgi:hypothetical protein